MEKLTHGARVANLASNHFVTDHIKVHHLYQKYLLQLKRKLLTCAHAKKQRIRASATALIKAFKDFAPWA